MSRAPVRLLEQGNLSEHERALLESAYESAPIEYDLDEGAARFRTALAALSAAGAAAGVVHGVKASGASAAASKAALIKLAAKLLLGMILGASVAGGGLVTGILLARQRDPVATTAAKIGTAEASARAMAIAVGSLSAESSAASESLPGPVTAGATAASRMKRPAVSRARSDSLHPSAGSAGAASIANEVEEGSDSVRMSNPLTPERAQSRQAPPPSAQPEPERPAAVDHSPSEVAGIAIAKDLVERDPKAALKVLDELRRNYPRGYFVEEREALTVLALAGTGQTAAARRQAQAFLRAFPNGPFSDRVRAVLASEN